MSSIYCSLTVACGYCNIFLLNYNEMITLIALLYKICANVCQSRLSSREDVVTLAYGCSLSNALSYKICANVCQNKLSSREEVVTLAYGGSLLNALLYKVCVNYGMCQCWSK